MLKGWILGLVQVAVVGAIAVQASRENKGLPHAWARTQNISGASRQPDSRYLVLWIEAPADMEGRGPFVQLQAVDGALRGSLTTQPTGVFLSRVHPGVLSMPVEFLLPEHAPDPTVRAPGEELWAEVLVPPRGMPRPVRLAVKKDGRLEPVTSLNAK